MMEKLLHYIWKHKMFPLHELRTDDGRSVEVIDAGLHNHNAGPDFFNAKLKIDGVMWVGNVELHVRSTDWYMHGHDNDAAYNNVVLHVAAILDRDVYTQAGTKLPQLQLEVPRMVADNYRELLTIDRYPPCYKIISQLSKLTMHGWMGYLQTERLERKTEDIRRRVERCEGSWEAALFVTMARNYGFGVNGDAFERWAMNIPLSAVAHHRDDVFQIEALFLGQAGLLDERFVPKRNIANALKEGYFTRLKDEYSYLARKFGLKPMDANLWRFLRLRPQNFPHIRISQLANLYHSRRAELGRLIECRSVEQLRDVLDTGVTPYWETHYLFGSESAQRDKCLSLSSLDVLIINTAVPVLFAYGRHKQDEQLCERAIGFLESLKAERNHIVSMWRECGMDVSTAGDSQGLIQLKREYCDRKDCLRCRIGYEYLKRKTFSIE